MKQQGSKPSMRGSWLLDIGWSYLSGGDACTRHSDPLTDNVLATAGDELGHLTRRLDAVTILLAVYERSWVVLSRYPGLHKREIEALAEFSEELLPGLVLTEACVQGRERRRG